MKLFKNMKIGGKIISGFVIIAVLTAIMGIITYVNFSKMDKLDTELYEKNTKAISSLGNAAVSYQRMRVNIREFFENDQAGKEKNLAKIAELKVTLEKDLTDFQKTNLSNDESIQLENLRKNIQGTYELWNNVISMVNNGKVQEGRQELFVNGKVIATAVDDQFNKMVDYNLSQASNKSDSNSETARGAKTIIIVLTFIVSIFALIIGWLISRSISKPVNKLTDNARKLAKGDIEVEKVAIEGKDEIAELFIAFDNMIENIRSQAIITERIAKGEYYDSIEAKSEKDVLGNSLIKLNSNIKNILAETSLLTAAAKDGQLNRRGDANKFSGGWSVLITGVNELLDEILKPISEASEVLKAISNGDLNVAVKGEYKGDHAIIKNNLNATISNLRGYIDDISYTLTEMSSGNLTISISKDYLGDFRKIKDSINLIVDSLNSTLKEISDVSEQVASGANMISNSAQSMASAATEQASVIEEITASITEIASQTTENSANVNKANSIATEASVNAIKGNEHMKEMLLSMEDINRSAVDISKIIKVIDEIAFQTNILALNAAVEAARAGQQGKGFAVVADEVRNLAARSSKAAKETTELIESSISKAESGKITANETAKVLDGIVDKIGSVAEIMEQISEASSEQATASTQVNQAIEEVAETTQINSTSIEESASASEELSLQANVLKEKVSKFKFKK
ncbi:MCP four helix bundle domain-containing protein [Clostridium sp. YIM B02505]|uniref:MCP four helix bundle domain-containing protein n=1 Tax=Clostridium yunnanense TaxID=2800325 RepID=A0ABS1EL29_9CLOT|nr:methyl-accepting chemotaxis protein [Clostridium yunnanense]MBK1810076.1 MCP four helix bundle domain-containing protein [Clostridium yunnanense]